VSEVRRRLQSRVVSTVNERTKVQIGRDLTLYDLVDEDMAVAKRDCILPRSKSDWTSGATRPRLGSLLDLVSNLSHTYTYTHTMLHSLL